MFDASLRRRRSIAPAIVFVTGVFASGYRDDPFAAWAVHELAAVKSGGTLGEWMRAHPADSLDVHPPVGSHVPANWCAGATTETPLPDSSRALRHAYFFVPPLTPEARLPTPGPAESRTSDCPLGAVLVELRTPTDGDAIRLATETGAALARTFAAVPESLHQERSIPLAPGSNWKVAGPWDRDSLTMFSAAETRRLGRGPRVVAIALTPASDPAGPVDTTRTWAQGYRRDSTAVAVAAQLTGLDAAAVAPLTRLLAQAESIGPGLTHTAPASLQASLLTTVRTWLTRTRSLNPPYRAAALLAADRLLGSVAASSFGLGDDADRPGFDSTPYHVLAGMGAAFGNDKWQGMVYMHTWLNQAYRLDPRGRAGAFAFTDLIESAFDTTRDCGSGEDPFQTVIDRGEAFLPRVTDSSVAARLHFVI